MRSIRLVVCALFILAGTCSRLVAQPWTLIPSSLACTIQSGFNVTKLPACTKSALAFHDYLLFSVLAACESPCAQINLPAITLEQDIGRNGVCQKGVAWTVNGGVSGVGSSAYVWGTFGALSTIDEALVRGSESCDGVPFYDGDLGKPVLCQ